MKGKELVALVVIVFILGVLFGTCLGIYTTTETLTNNAIRNGLAEYRANPITGEVKCYSLCTCKTNKTNKLCLFDGDGDRSK